MKSIITIVGLGVLTVGSGFAATTYDVKVYDTVSIGDTQLKKGDYKLEMKGDKAVFKSAKTSVEVPATTGKSDMKFNANSFITEGTKLIELDLGGTTEKIFFTSPPQNAAGGK